MSTLAMGLDRRNRWGAVIVIGACAAILGATALAGFAPAIRARLGWNTPDQLAYVAGASIDLPPSLYKNGQTLVVFATGTCGACRRSAPALAALAADLRGSPTRFLLVTPNVRHVDQQDLVQAVGLSDSEVAALDLSKLRLKNVPAVVLVDRSGRILFSREGLVDDEGQAAIRRAIADRQL